MTGGKSLSATDEALREQVAWACRILGGNGKGERTKHEDCGK